MIPGFLVSPESRVVRIRNELRAGKNVITKQIRLEMKDGVIQSNGGKRKNIL